MTIGVPGNVHRGSCRAHCRVLQHELRRKDESIMNNNYETPEVLEFGQAQHLIRGMKWPDPLFCDSELGCGYRTMETDIDESDE